MTGIVGNRTMFPGPHHRGKYLMAVQLNKGGYASAVQYILGPLQSAALAGSILQVVKVVVKGDE